MELADPEKAKFARNDGAPVTVSVASVVNSVRIFALLSFTTCTTSPSVGFCVSTRGP